MELSLTEKFEKIRVQLLYSQPLYALMLQRCKISWLPEVKTAGVRPTEQGSVELAIAPEFLASLTEAHGVGLIMHEMLHLFMDHFRRGKRLNQRLANIAMDAAINQYIPEKNLPPGAVLPAQFELPNGESFEFYYLALLEKSKSQDQKSKDGDQKSEGEAGDQQSSGGSSEIGGETVDNHDWSQEPASGGSTSASLSQEIAQSIVDKVAKDAYTEAKKKFPGKVPAHLERMIEAINASPKLDWRSQLRKFVGRERSKEIESTRTRANRRMGFFAQGNQHTYFPKILVGVDESGSVSNQMHQIFLTELRSILKNADGATEIAFFDTEIAKKVTLRRASEIKAKRYAQGGTDFNCVFDYARTVRPDLLIILTDAGAPAPKLRAAQPVLWVICGNENADHLPGIKVNLEEK